MAADMMNTANTAKTTDTTNKTDIREPAELKTAALSMIKKCWAEALFICLVNVGIFAAIYILVLLEGRITGVHTADTVLPLFNGCNLRFFISMLVTVVFFYIAAAPVYYGTKWFYWQASGGNIMPVSSIFAGYSSPEQFRLCVKLRFITDIRKAPPFILFGIAAALEFFLARRMVDGGGTSLRVLVNICLAAMAGGVIYICFCLSMKYVPVGFMLADNPDAKVSDIFSRSIGLVNRRYGYMLRLYASFGGWFLLCLLIFPLIAFLPYLDMTLAVFIRECIKNPAPEKKKGRDKTDKKETAEAGA